MENKFKLKKFLATASAFAMITGASTAAMGANLTDTNNNVTFHVGNVGPFVGGGNFANNDTFYFSNAGKTLTTGGAVTIGSIDLNNKAPNAGGFTVAHATTVGPITDSTANGQTLNITINDGITLTLANNAGVNAAAGAIAAGTFDGVGNIVLGSGGGGSILTIDSNATLAGTVNSDAADDGVVNVNAGREVTFNGIVGGGQDIAEVNLLGAGSKVTFGAAATVTTVKIANATAELNINGGNLAGDVSFTADGTVNVADTRTITGKVDSGVANNNGVLNFAGISAVTAKVGQTKALKEVNVNGTTGVGVVAFGNIVNAQKVTINHDGAKVTFAEDVTAANGLQFSADGQATVAAGKKITGDVKNTVAAGVGGTFANTGKLIFAAAGEVTGAIGEEGKALKLVQVTGAGDVSLSANAHHSETFQFNNNNARLKIAAGGSLVGNLVANGGGNGKVQFAGAGEVKGTIGDAGGNGIGLIEANGAGIVKIGVGNHKANFSAATNAAAGFEFADGANVTGTIDENVGGVNTSLTFLGSSTVTGAVGATNPYNKIDIKGGADKTIDLQDDVEATNLNIGQAGQEGAAKVKIKTNLTAEVAFLDNKSQSGVLEIYHNGANHAVVGDIKTGGESRGTIVIAGDGGNAVANKTVTFNGNIGDIANKTDSLKMLHIQNNNANGIVELTGGNVHIAKIQAAGAGNLKLNKADGKYKFGEVALDQDNVFSLTVNENAVLKAPTEGSVNIGGALKRLKALEFTADKTLTIENGVNIYAGELNATGGNNNNGTLIFKGDSIFSAKSDGQNISAIEVQGDGTVTILKDIHTENDIKLSNNATLEVAGNVTTDTANGNNNDGNGLIGVADNNGKLKFINSGAVTVDGRVGATAAKLQSIEFNGGDVTFNHTVRHDARDLVFTGNNASKVTFKAANIGKAHFVNNSEADGVGHTVVLNTDEDFTGQIAIANPGTKQIKLDIGTNNKTATLNGGVQANGAYFINGNAADGKGTLTLVQDGVTVYGAGTANKKLLAVNVNESATITNGTHSVTTTIAQGKTATLGGTISGTNFALANAGSTVKFLDGATLKVAVTATTADKGIVEFVGGGAVEADKDIGAIGGGVNRVKTVTFSDDAAKTLAFDASAYAAEKIDIRKATLKVVNNDVVLNAPDVNAANASFYLGSAGKITVNGGNLNFTGNEGKIMVGVAQAGDTISGGQIIAGTGATLKYGANSAITVTPDDSNGSRPTGGASRTFTLIKNDTGNAATGTLLVKIDGSKNDFTKWTHSFDANGNLILTQIDGAADKIKELLGSNLDAVDTANIEALTQAENGTDAAKFVNEVLSKLTNNKAKLDEAIDRLTSVTTATDSIESSMASTVNGINTRLSLVGKQTAGTPVQSRALASAKVSGVAAGDDHARYGAWFSPFFSNTTQKARKGAAGYKDTSYGGSFGMDTRANDDLIIGAAVTFANSEMKHKDFKSGDKTKVNSLMFSIYALQQITDTWFSQGSATIASNEVKNTEKRVSSATAFDTVNGKYNSMSFVGDVLFGYNYATEGFTLTPMGGVRYTRVNSAGYKENGSTTGQNLNVSQKASNKFEVVVGGRVSGGTFDVNGMSVTPELHGFISHDLIGKNPKQDLRIGGAPSLTAKSRKPLKTEYNLGLGVNADYGMMEYGVGYDVHLAEKRVGHEGTLKVRVNF